MFLSVSATTGTKKIPDIPSFSPCQVKGQQQCCMITDWECTRGFATTGPTTDLSGRCEEGSPMYLQVTINPQRRLKCVFHLLLESNNKGFNWVVGPDYNSDRGGIISYRGGQPLLGSKWKYWNSVVDGNDAYWAHDNKLNIRGCVNNVLTSSYIYS